MTDLTSETSGTRDNAFTYGALLGTLGTLLLTSPAARSAASLVLRFGGKAIAAGMAVKLLSDVLARPGSDQLIPEMAQTQEIKLAQLRAAIAAVRSDGAMSENERQAILQFADALQLDSAGRVALIRDMDRDFALDDITRSAVTPELSRLIFAASIYAIDSTAPSKRTYLNRLASALNLGRDTAGRIEAHVRGRT